MEFIVLVGGLQNTVHPQGSTAPLSPCMDSGDCECYFVVHGETVTSEEVFDIIYRKITSLQNIFQQERTRFVGSGIYGVIY